MYFDPELKLVWASGREATKKHQYLPGQKKKKKGKTSPTKNREVVTGLEDTNNFRLLKVSIFN